MSVLQNLSEFPINFCILTCFQNCYRDKNSIGRYLGTKEALIDNFKVSKYLPPSFMRTRYITSTEGN